MMIKNCFTYACVIPSALDDIVGKQRVHPHIFHFFYHQRRFRGSFTVNIIRKPQLSDVVEHSGESHVVLHFLIMTKSPGNIPGKAAHINAVRYFLCQIIINNFSHISLPKRKY